MALVKCPECGKEVSEGAPSCPKCGCPIKAVTIEKTGKKWKGLILISILMFIFGISLFAAGEESAVLGGILVASAPVLFIIALIGRWWFHS